MDLLCRRLRSRCPFSRRYPVYHGLLCQCGTEVWNYYHLKKTEVLLQPKSGAIYAPPTVKVNGSALKSVEKFTYLRSSLSQNPVLDDKIAMCLNKASVAFGSFTGQLWNEHGIVIVTKVKVYRAVIIATLLYGCETWTLYRRHIRQLDRMHMCCLRNIANGKINYPTQKF